MSQPALLEYGKFYASGSSSHLAKLQNVSLIISDLCYLGTYFRCRYFYGRGIDDDKGGIVPVVQVKIAHKQ